MKHGYRYICCTFILFFTEIVSIAPKKFTSAQLARLGQERLTNLVIINDGQEYLKQPKSLLYQMISQNKDLDIGAMHTEFLRAMSSDQLVLVPKLLWISVQNVVAAFNDCVSPEFEFRVYSAQCRKLKSLYDEINITNASSESSLKFLFNSKRLKLELLKNQLKDVLNDPTIDPKIRFNIQEMFSTYMYHESLVRQGYVCKQVTNQSTDLDKQENDFLLFVPKVLQNANEDSMMQDALLGLSWTELPDYAYTQTVSDSDLDKILESSNKVFATDAQGEQLLKALDVLEFTNASVPRELLPFLNVYLTGHGSQNSVTAEISIIPKQNQDGSMLPSDFVQVLNFLNSNFRTQSLAISSCYAAGKKLVDTYQIDNFYNNAGLEDISYPLIMVGSTFQPTTAFVVSAGLTYNNTIHFSSSSLYLPQILDPVNKYFADLNQSSPDYQHAVKVLSESVQSVESGATNIRNPQNYASVKMPHVSWFSAAQYANNVKQLSQVAMSTTNEPIIISSNVKLVLLSANFMPQTIQFNDTSSLPKLLPVNYKNQNYYFELVVMTDGLDDLSKIIAHFFVSEIEEPVNIIFKNLTLSLLHETYSNVAIFMHQDVKGDGSLSSGYMYTDEKGETKIASWPSDEKMPNSVIEVSYDAEDLQKHVDVIAGKVQENLPTALKTEFVEKLSSKLDVKKSEGLSADATVEPKSNWVKDPVTGKWSSDLFPVKQEEKRSVEPIVAEPVTHVGLPTTSKEFTAQQIENARLVEHNSKSWIDSVKNISLFRNSQNITNDKKVSFTEWLRGQADRKAVENRMNQLSSGHEGRSGEGI